MYRRVQVAWVVMYRLVRYEVMCRLVQVARVVMYRLVRYEAVPHYIIILFSITTKYFLSAIYKILFRKRHIRDKSWPCFVYFVQLRVLVNK